MDSYRLRYFITVNETSSIRKAADLISISPAALSKAMKQLEEEVGFPLLVPSGRGILVTERGKELAKRARPLLEGLDTLVKNTCDPQEMDRSRAPSLRIGSFEVFTTYFLTSLLHCLPKETKFFLREFIPGDIEKALIEKEIDYGITYIPIPTLGVDHQKIANIEAGIFGHKKFLDKAFEEIPFVIPIRPITGSPTKVQGLDGWPDDQIPRLVLHRVTLMESALELCRHGIAVAYFPSFIVGLHNKTVAPEFHLHLLSPPKNLNPKRQGVYLVRRKSEPEGEIYKKIAKAIRLTCH